MAEKPAMSYPQAMKDFFGLHPGQTLALFVGELKALTPADKAEMVAGLKANGYTLKD